MAEITEFTMRIEKIDLTHREVLNNALKKIDTFISEYSFPNLYLFRKSHTHEVVFDEEIFISGVANDGFKYLMPAKDIRSMDPEYLKKMIARFGALFPIPEEWLSVFNPDEFVFTHRDEESDYIHLIEKMGTYKGKNLHGKKNLLNQFLRLYANEALPLTVGRLGDARVILEQWQKDSGTDPEKTDYRQCLEAIGLYDELMLCGGIYYADGEPAGFIIGEEINDRTFALHFAKGRRKFKGIYQFMFNSFAKIMPEKYCCFNFEQDLGIESLRDAKASYRPEMMVKKYRVSLR